MRSRFWLTAFVIGAGFLAATPRAGSQASNASTSSTVALLSELIRRDTSNPPGREGLVAELLAPRFKALGFEVDIVATPEPGKAHFIARLRGDGSKRPDILGRSGDAARPKRAVRDVRTGSAGGDKDLAGHEPAI